MVLLRCANTLRFEMNAKQTRAIDVHRQEGSRWTKTGLRAGAMLLGVYAALHLAAAGIIRLATGHDAAAFVAPDAPRCIDH